MDVWVGASADCWGWRVDRLLRRWVDELLGLCQDCSDWWVASSLLSPGGEGAGRRSARDVCARLSVIPSFRFWHVHEFTVGSKAVALFVQGAFRCFQVKRCLIKHAYTCTYIYTSMYLHNTHAYTQQYYCTLGGIDYFIAFLLCYICAPVYKYVSICTHIYTHFFVYMYICCLSFPVFFAGTSRATAHWPPRPLRW